MCELKTNDQSYLAKKCLMDISLLWKKESTIYFSAAVIGTNFINEVTWYQIH